MKLEITKKQYKTIKTALYFAEEWESLRANSYPTLDETVESLKSARKFRLLLTDLKRKENTNETRI